MIYSIPFDIMFVGEFIVHMNRVTGKISVTDDNYISANIGHLDVMHFLQHCIFEFISYRSVS